MEANVHQPGTYTDCSFLNKNDGSQDIVQYTYFSIAWLRNGKAFVFNLYLKRTNSLLPFLRPVPECSHFPLSSNFDDSLKSKTPLGHNWYTYGCLNRIESCLENTVPSSLTTTFWDPAGSLRQDQRTARRVSNSMNSHQVSIRSSWILITDVV